MVPTPEQQAQLDAEVGKVWPGSHVSFVGWDLDGYPVEYLRVVGPGSRILGESPLPMWSRQLPMERLLEIAGETVRQAITVCPAATAYGAYTF